MASNNEESGAKWRMSFFVQEDDETLQLWNAIQKGELINIQVLVDEGVNVNTADRNGNTALHTAASMKKDDIVKELINAGADIDTENDNGQTALHLAASKGYIYIVMQLLDAGCQVDKKTKFTGMTALHMAAKLGHSDVVQLIMDYGADINAKDIIERRPSDYSGSQEVAEMFDEYRKRLHRRRPSKQRRHSRKISHDPIPGISEAPELNKSSKYDSESLHGLPSNENEGYRLDKIMAKSFQTKTVHDKEKKGGKSIKSAPTGPVNYKLEYSDKHKKRMQLSVFDRLTKK